MKLVAVATLMLLTPVNGSSCLEDPQKVFTASQSNKNQTCAWLAARPNQQPTLCDPKDSSGAYTICPKTCKKCIPACADTKKTFNTTLCVPGKPAWKYCPYTCTGCNASKPRKTPAPTFAPVAGAGSQQTPSPTATNLPPFPGGPYITSSNATERITLPQPPTPNLPTDKTGCPHLQPGLSDWIDPETWPSGSVPTAGQNVILPANTKVIIRQSISDRLGVITIPSSSELIIGEDSVGINIDAQGFDVQGSLTAGSETCRIDAPITITLHGSRPANAVTNPREPTYKGIAVTGMLNLHGKRFFRTWTRLATSVNPGGNVLVLQDPVNWQPGQQIVVVTTAIKDSLEWHQNEVLEVAKVHPNPPSGVGAIVYLVSGVQYRHIANSGYQGEVGLLTRTIKIQGAADSEPSDPDPLNCVGRNMWGSAGQPCPNTELTGFGGHVAVMGSGRGYVEGIELYRMGQTNVLGRYPMHFHLLGDCPTCYFRDSSVHRSYYRCISIHGTSSSTVSENVAYDVKGFCFYLEDGVEENNTISFNLAAHIHIFNTDQPFGLGQESQVYQQSSTLTNPADVVASGFYITNANNNIIGNAASGGWAGFAFPNLPTALQSFRNLGDPPSRKASLVIDGNTAHSTGWWWSRAGGFYWGGSLYYNGNTLFYNAGQAKSSEQDRRPCLVNPCSFGDCTWGCPVYQEAWNRISNSKAFLIPGVGLNSWFGNMEVLGFESHDVGLSLNSLSFGFWVENLLSVCRTGEDIIFPRGGNAGVYMDGKGFYWYDTMQEHIITRSVFRNCGYRSSNYAQYDSSPTRGCDNDYATGCTSESSVFGFLAHSDQYIPDIMQGTRDITFENCGRRFQLWDYRGVNAPVTTVSGRLQNWIDVDGSASGLNEPTLIASGQDAAKGWWQVDDEVVFDPQGPLRFIKTNNGPQRGLASFRMLYDSSVNSQVGQTVCSNQRIPLYRVPPWDISDILATNSAPTEVQFLAYKAYK